MTHDELLRQIAEMTEKLSDEEFHRLMEFFNAEYRTRLQRAAKLATLTLRPGDWVETIQQGRHIARGARGRVLHFARSRIHVRLLPNRGSGHCYPRESRKSNGTRPKRIYRNPTEGAKQLQPVIRDP
jgi:hypothetical protein